MHNAKGQKLLKTSRKKKMFAEDMSEDSQKIEDITFTGFLSISGYLRNLCGRLLSSEKVLGSFYPLGFYPSASPDFPYMVYSEGPEYPEYVMQMFKPTVFWDHPNMGIC